MNIISLNNTINKEKKNNNIMKINNIKIRHLYGTIDTDGDFWEERLVRPIDIYSELN